MARWYALIFLVSVEAFIPDSYDIPDCPHLGKYTMDPDVKTDLVTKVFENGPIKDDFSLMAYDCELEKKAGQILEDPHKSLDEVQSLGMHPLVYEMYVILSVYYLPSLGLHKTSLIRIAQFSEEEPDIPVTIMTEAAIQTWKPHIPYVSFATSFGCNYRNEHGKHKYLCLLK
ncbi:hypothetical protein Y032_0457g1813 [Ancylostoma ceylanicum]|uniref:SCP domain-containing protein n=1 Tax=Ancylostoma ceylanicum TaxID=53326 RepID=A0A016WZB1_9BILA|nr:hypothetical protein Y032_0457g1813 [Ancylostoma ceylanicum]